MNSSRSRSSAKLSISTSKGFRTMSTYGGIISRLISSADISPFPLASNISKISLSFKLRRASYIFCEWPIDLYFLFGIWDICSSRDCIRSFFFFYKIKALLYKFSDTKLALLVLYCLSRPGDVPWILLSFVKLCSFYLLVINGLPRLGLFESLGYYLRLLMTCGWKNGWPVSGSFWLIKLYSYGLSNLALL